jgi:hypothetical protein
VSSNKKNIGAAAGVFIFACTFVSSANADEFERRLKTVYLEADYGLSTYKSKLVESNDTGSITSYTIGANIGADKPVAFVIRSDQSAISFLLNESAITSSWRDTIIRYRWGYMYVGGVMGQTTWEVKSAGADLFAGTGSGYGGNFGIMFPIGARNLFTIDATSMTASTFVEKNEQDVKMGARTDINMYGNIGLTRDSLDLIVGYRQRSHSISYLSTSYAEIHTATFFGFQMGSDF